MTEERPSAPVDYVGRLLAIADAAESLLTTCPSLLWSSHDTIRLANALRAIGRLDRRQAQ